jgi:hypothetical protein
MNSLTYIFGWSTQRMKSFLKQIGVNTCEFESTSTFDF